MSDITAEAVSVDAFVLSQTDNAGGITTSPSPLAIQKDGTWYTYGWDLTKNICELYGSNGYIRTAYTYSPYGSVTESGNSVYQPIQWSSEYHDTELGLVYYNHRHYNPMDGRWLGRDLENKSDKKLYTYTGNKPYLFDILGLDDANNNVEVYFCKYHFGITKKEKEAEIKYSKHFKNSCDSEEDFLVFSKKAHDKCKSKCVEELVIIAHGAAEESDDGKLKYVTIALGEDEFMEADFEDARRISNLFRNIKFCKKCKIELRSCHIGRSSILMKRLREKYKCDVILYAWYVSGRHPWINYGHKVEQKNK